MNINDPTRNYTIDEFTRLIYPGCIGYYNSCSITSIIAVNSKQNDYKNIFTLATFEENDFKDYKLKYHTPKLVRINKEWAISIVTQRVTLEDARNLYCMVTQENSWQQPNCPPLTLSKLKIMNSQFVSIAEGIPLASVLKNAYRYSNYVFELFSEEKPLLRHLSPYLDKGHVSETERKICEVISEYLPIDLEYIKDRWENIVFQFPVNLVKIDFKGCSDERHLLLNFNWHPLVINNPPLLIVQCHTELDGLIFGNCVWQGKDSEAKLFLGDTDGKINIIVNREDSRTLLFKQSASLFKKINISFSIMSQDEAEIHVPQRRKDEPKYSYKVKFKTTDDSSKKSDDWMSWISQRVHLESLRRLEKSLEFIQYGAHGKNERQKALRDIRTLIEQHGKQGAFLWDPFIDGGDILATLFACTEKNTPLRVITSFNREVRNINESNQEIKPNYMQWVKDLQEHLKNGLQYRYVNLEVRCQHNSNGWNFHDRFLIFPFRKPMVWSLGASLNTIGRSHSILMKVQHSQPVLDAFENLWNELGECVVWP